MTRLKAIYAYLCDTNFAYLLVLGLVVKALVHDISYPSFLLSIPVLGFEAYKIYLNSKKPDPVAINKEVMEELDKLKSKVNANTFEKGMKASGVAPRFF